MVFSNFLLDISVSLWENITCIFIYKMRVEHEKVICFGNGLFRADRVCSFRDGLNPARI